MSASDLFAPGAALHGMTVLERGWLSSNNVLMHAAAGETGAVLVDSSHSLHAQQTVALLRQTLADQPLKEVVNTHLHSDHCGGNAAVQQAFGCSIRIPPGHFEAALNWDQDSLTYVATGQQCARFAPDGLLKPGEPLQAAGRRWDVLAAPGHDPHSVLLFDAGNSVLISADALWENGFGLIFPEIEGQDAFDDAAQVLDLIEQLNPHVVIPGHGAVFTDVAGALQRARRRLAGFVADPRRHAWHATKVLLKYHLMEVRQQPLQDLQVWLQTAPLMQRLWQLMGSPDGGVVSLGQRAVDELCANRVLAQHEGLVSDA